MTEKNGRPLIQGYFSACLLLVTCLTLSSAFAENVWTPPLSGPAYVSDDSEESIKQRSGPGNVEAGREKSQLCQGCHGEFGHSTDPMIPKLAGQFGNYIAKQVRNYQAGTRTHQIMNAMAGTLSDEDVADVAAYFASQEKMKGDGSAENQVGKDLFLHGRTSRMLFACVNCHGVRGKGLGPRFAMFPVIGGQHKAYIRRQLLQFRVLDRTNSPNSIMNKITNQLTDEEIDALAEYVSVQP